ncbi:Rac GTPase activating protein 1 [Xenopus tropicalis]|uniref:Novel protein containing RhoGAP domain n=1 Tax=Xenopus tropicalis TaxID=8364 RepID=Q28GA0_XENTR|nr:Rac GTPase activating protein 1 gene2 [Xenopus tropicalis]CAJ83922.1 novel protein containing RhoGAP domain [Xenopus tropicalis]|eukprot:NP_001037947.1 Rac GTPase activating protein 1 [Xenopus tropicalis]
MGDTRKKALQSYLDRILKFIEFNVSAEDEFIQVARSFETSRKKLQQTEQELRDKRETLVKCEIERSALQVKLKHARNQVDVEMKKRQRAETKLEKAERQIQLIGDLLKTDGQTAVPLSDSVLAYFGGSRVSTAPQTAGKRLSVVDESCTSFLSDISYDHTEDDLDLDELGGKPTKLKARERRRSSLIAPLLKRPRPSEAAAIVAENVRETVIANTALLVSDTGPFSAVEAAPRRRSRKSRPLSSLQDQTPALPQINEEEKEMEPEPPPYPTRTHVYLSRTMIRAELCMVCGQKVRFGKMCLKCKDCRILIHPECKDFCPKVCSSALPSHSTNPKNGPGVLADYAPAAPPRVPSQVVQCVNEIEKRGFSERGIYRIPGCDRLVKELKQKLLQGKIKAQHLAKEDVHTVCGALKEFFRTLQEPLLTYSLHATFLDAADILDECDGRAETCQAVHDLPAPNRDTLAFLILHLYRVMRSPECKMDKTNLSRIFGPTLVGYSVPNPSPLMIMQDTPRQAKVMSMLLSIPCAFWDQFLFTNQENKDCNSAKLDQERLFRPVTSPEINSGLLKASPYLTQSSSKSDLPKKAGRFFTSPNA